LLRRLLKGVAALAAVSGLRRAHVMNLGSGAVEASLGCAPEQCDHRYATTLPWDLLPFKIPQVLLHGTADETVPFELSQQFVGASTNARLVALHGADHLDLIDLRTAIWPTVLRNILAPIVSERLVRED